MMMNQSYIDTIDFGRVPVRRTHTDGKHLADIELSDNGTNELFAEVRSDNIPINHLQCCLIRTGINYKLLENGGKVKCKE